MYLSFKAESNSAKFFIHASYSATQKNTKFVNKEKCSDAGASLGDALDFNTDNNNSGGSSDNNGGGSVSLNPKIDIVTKTGRESYIRNQLNESIYEESFSQIIEEKKDNLTFKILMLVVGVLLIIVAILMMLNTWVTRK